MACDSIDLPGVRSVLLEAVDGLEPKEEVASPLWEVDIESAQDDLSQVSDAGKKNEKVTSLFKD